MPQLIIYKHNTRTPVGSLTLKKSNEQCVTLHYITVLYVFVEKKIHIYITCYTLGNASFLLFANTYYLLFSYLLLLLSFLLCYRESLLHALRYNNFLCNLEPVLIFINAITGKNIAGTSFS